MAISVHLDIVSSEAQIYSGLVEMVVVSGIMGELGVLPGHAPLLTHIKPGYIKMVKQGGIEEFFYVSGGTLEVQPDNITILADTVVRATELDENAAIKAKEDAAMALARRGNGDSSDDTFSKALIQLARAIAQLRTIKLARGKTSK